MTQPHPHAGLLAQRATEQTAAYFYATDPQADLHGHDMRTKARVAESLARFLGYDYAGPWHEGLHGRARDEPMYLVPSDTLVGLEGARSLGVGSVDNLFGGVVPHPFVATKAITHPLWRPDGQAPEGWSHEFGRRVHGAVLPGYTVFDFDDALAAGARLLDLGAVRVKDTAGVGGIGQWVVNDEAELRQRVEAYGRGRLLSHGLVLEANLTQVVTHSVGQVQAGRMTISYYGTQSLTRNQRGHHVYGGSDLQVVRGAFDDLLQLELRADVRQAIEQAIVYHRAAMDCFSGMFASRCNYDVAQGLDGAGRECSGVLEQSWRIGGASGAEVAAMHALDADPALGRVRACTTEVHGGLDILPAGAWLTYDGTDPNQGRLTKYVQVHPHGDD